MPILQGKSPIIEGLQMANLQMPTMKPRLLSHQISLQIMRLIKHFLNCYGISETRKIGEWISSFPMVWKPL